MHTILTYLKESKANAEYEKNYSSIPKDIYLQIINMDPKTQIIGDDIKNIGFGSKQLLLPKYMSGEVNFINNGDAVKNALEDYYRNISKYPRFNEFSSVADFLTFIENPSAATASAPISTNPVDEIYNKYYGEIPRDTFDLIISLDPNTTKTRIGNIARNLLLNRYLRGEQNIFNNDLTELKRACKRFIEDKSTYPDDKQDLMQYPSIESFVKYVLEGPESSMVSYLKSNNLRDEHTDRPVSQDVRVVASTKDYDILEPKSHRANQAISGGFSNPDGMRWCTGWEGTNDTYWKNYTQNGARIFCFMHKTRNRGTQNREINWQVQVLRDNSVGEFLNGDDRRAFPGNTKEDQFINFLKAYPEILLAIKDKEPFSNMPVVQSEASLVKYLDEPFILTERTAKELQATSLKSIIRDVIVDVKKIPAGCFAGYMGLRTVKFNEGLVEIGAQAFKGCVAVKTYVFPETLEVIGAEAFAGNTELRGSIKLPNSLREVHTRAFMNDHCKLKIDRDRKTPIQFDSADRAWVNSHVQSIKVQ